MTDRPILMSGPMVRAIIDGRKSQTRRVFTPPPPFDIGDDISVELAVGSIKAPYAPGDRLIPCIEIPGFGGMYAAGSDGNIYSFAKGDERRLAATVPKGKGYPSVSLLRPDGKASRRSVHRVICEAFYGPPPSVDHECRHLDGNVLNGHPGNLAWGTREENWLDRKAHGHGVEGEKHHAAKFSDDDRAHIRWAIERGLVSTRSAARALGVAQSTVQAIYNWRPESAPQDVPEDRIPGITLLVDAVKVERLQDISEEDAVAEGISAQDVLWLDRDCPDCRGLSAICAESSERPDLEDMQGEQCRACSRLAFEVLWDSINGPGSWDANPWVVVVSFRPILANIDSVES